MNPPRLHDSTRPLKRGAVATEKTSVGLAFVRPIPSSLSADLLAQLGANFALSCLETVVATGIAALRSASRLERFAIERSGRGAGWVER